MIENRNNIVVDQALKAAAHDKGLLHCCVVAMIRHSNGQWLLVKQAADRQDAGQYVAPVGGHVSAGEDADDALRREAAEEIGFVDDFTFKYLGS